MFVILASVKESFNQPYIVKTVLESKTVEKVSEEKNLGPGNQSKQALFMVTYVSKKGQKSKQVKNFSKRIVASRLNGKK